jgi:CRISPR/Cas system CSM-associated protein Csm2 small subunit
MKTKIIREFYDEIREREIEEKLKGKKNITAE